MERSGTWDPVRRTCSVDPGYFDAPLRKGATIAIIKRFRVSPIVVPSPARGAHDFVIAANAVRPVAR